MTDPGYVPPPFGWTYVGRRPKYGGYWDRLDDDMRRHSRRLPLRGEGPIPAPEPFPDGPLHWDCIRLDEWGLG